MSTAKTLRPSARMQNLISLAQLFERLDRDPTGAGIDQYRLLMQRLGKALETAEPGPVLQVVLDTHPATAELYENLHYAHAGLCRSPLEDSLRSEHAALQAIAQARAPLRPADTR
ncbi:hypothetical protein C7444_101236 [Sphaerotilus hippei]|uniref:Uncharacterized protein n=1 Tax=Sphaerotilus hippei TaxID=744406 RepID=A0A318H5R2_9BURK|nr:hypothetical protein [Sphaerotilus hippei]PXW99406.1 hypothetical protein C7444_101236 [Sphaerotilus hippei]